MKIRKVGLLLLTIFCSAGFLFAGGTEEKESYPKKPIELMVPVKAGGSTDITGRSLASLLQKYLGKPVVVVNKGGAGGQLGMNYLLDKKPDGYSIGISTIGPWTIYPAMFPDAKFSYKNFKNIAIVEIVPTVLVAKSSSKYRDFKEFVSYLKNNPKSLKYGIAATGSVSELGIKIFLKEAGVYENFVCVPFDGTGETLMALLGGHIDFMFVNLSPVYEHIKNGDLTAMAMGAPSRLEDFPDVPTFKEAGYEKAGISGWKGVSVLKDTPDFVVEKLEDAIEKAVNDEEWQMMKKKLGEIPVYMNCKDTEDFMDKQFSLFQKSMK